MARVCSVCAKGPATGHNVSHANNRTSRRWYPNLQTVRVMVEGAPNVEMRVFLRDQNPDLMDQYLNRGLFRSIPVFVFFDGDMKEVTRFIERPPKITEYMEQKQLELRRQLRAQHGSEWQRSAAEEIRALLG